MKTFTVEEISKSDGKDGNPSLVVVEGRVYDVSASKRWTGGIHMRRHQAGSDLTSDLKAAPHGTEVLERVGLVGQVVQPARESSAGLRGSLEGLLEKHPFFRRHPHPAIVHFPLGLLMVVPILQIAALLTRSSATEWAAYLLLVIGSVSIVGSIATGYLTWVVNYEASDSKIIKSKRLMAWLAFALAVVAFYTRTFVVNDPLQVTDPYVLLYTLNVLGLSAAVGYTGFLGGKLTFPYE